MNISRPLGSEVSSVSFSLYTPEEIRRISVRQITNPVAFDNLGHPTKGGLYDSALGPHDKYHHCTTCGLDHFGCPGHFGHIELPVAVYNPMFFKHMYSVLRAKCFHCHYFRMGRVEIHTFIARLKLLQHGLLQESCTVDRILEGIKKKNNNWSGLTGVDRKDSKIQDSKEDEEMEESVEGYIHGIEKYVKDCLQNISAESAKSHKLTLINDERKKVLTNFLKRANLVKKCLNCGAFTPGLKKDGFAKIFIGELSKKAQAYMNAQGLKIDEIRTRLLKTEKEQVDSYTNNAMDVDKDDDSESETDINHAKTEVTEVTSLKKTDEKETNESSKTKRKHRPVQKYVDPLSIRAHIRQLFIKESPIVNLMYGSQTSNSETPNPIDGDIFFLHALPVAPTRFRPISTMGDKQYDSPQNELLAKILITCERVRDLTVSLRSVDKEKKGADYSKYFEHLISAQIQLQDEVNSFLDSTKQPSTRGGRHDNVMAGIRQTLEKKEGLFRKHMMGKRVNYAARSVISPDPNIETSEIGIPPIFAKKLTYPEPVTHYNVKDMMQAVINGADTWPGASFVQHEDGTLTSLANLSEESRHGLAQTLLTPQDSANAGSTLSYYPTRTQPTNKKVYRHLRNGDLLLLNRQPTLHKPSIMAHRARILSGEKTIRMHYANCGVYNADFDGDEMNVHFPQNEIARAEAMFIANTDSQYLIPTSGNPVRGLIQDHVVAGVWMTSKNTFLTRDEYQQILYGSLRPEEDGTGGGRILTIPPAILKPIPLWTGKQVISTILKNLTVDQPQLCLESKAQVPAKFWGVESEENGVIFMDGELLCGVLDKSQFGAKEFGMVHSCHEIYGPSVAGMLLSILGRLFNKFNQWKGFSCRMDDLRLTTEADKWRQDLLHDGQGYGAEAALEYVGLSEMAKIRNQKELDQEFKRRMEEVLREDEKLAGLDRAMKAKMNKLTGSVIKKCIPDGLLKQFPENNMQMMTVSGAKGSNVNVSQISCLLGQQELEGRRVPIMVSGKSLPSFHAFDTSARAGGFISGRFLTGIRPQEFYFHCMAGREGLIDTAVKTSRSGYLQRCLIKHLEGLKVHYDHTVRDSDGSVLQFNYGEDSLDVTKQKHLYQFKFSALNYRALIQKYNPRAALERLESEEGEAYMKKTLKKPSKYDPALSKFNPSTSLGVISEKFGQELAKYIEKNPDNMPFHKSTPVNPNDKRFHGITKSKFLSLMSMKYLHSLVAPGEAVGLLAAQSIGEPSTQMTLNTFHFAGFGAKNVTLGIPRLREIIMTASAHIKTPNMTLPLLDYVTHEQALKFAKNINRLRMSELVDEVVVTEKTITTQHGRVKSYTIRLKFFTRHECMDEYNVRPSQIEDAIEKAFITAFEKAINREIEKKRSRSKGAQDGNNSDEEIGKPLKQDKSRVRQSFDDDEDADAGGNESDNGDGDATSSRLAKKSQQAATYEEPDSDDEAVINTVDKAMESDIEDQSEDIAQSDSDDDNNIKAITANAEEKMVARKARIVEKHQYVKNYVFDTENAWCEIEMEFKSDTPKLLMVSIVEKVCQEVVIHEIKGISRCYHNINETENDKSRSLVTDGMNLRGIWSFYDIIDLNKINSNDIAAILTVYGVEAARSAIMKEVAGVFEVYGIKVDMRHLSLIADYMTFEGGYRPFNRLGIESNGSPFLKMSFETTCHFLTKATLHGDYDTLDSPSARLVMGKAVKEGTGSFEILQPLILQP